MSVTRSTGVPECPFVSARGGSITRTLVDRYVSRPLTSGIDTGLGELTDREREAVALVAHGQPTTGSPGAR